MAIVKKITTGFVIQTIDTDTNEFTHQEFIAGDVCDYEDENGNPVDYYKNGNEPYLPYDMLQPEYPKKEDQYGQKL